MSNSNFIKDNLRQLHSDVVYLCQLDDDSYLYFLVEHQSSPDKHLGFRMLKYKVQLLEQHVAQGHEQMPLVQSICIYAGKQRPYPYSIDLHASFKSPELSKVLLFDLPEPEWGDLTLCTEELFKSYGRSEFVVQMLNQGPKEEFFSWVESHPELVKKLLEKSYSVKGV